jgi:hypothetical protein
MVPVIQDGDFIRWDSESVIRRLASRWSDTNLSYFSPFQTIDFTDPL